MANDTRRWIAGALALGIWVSGSAAADTTIQAPCLAAGQVGKTRVDLESCTAALRRTDDKGSPSGLLDVIEAKFRARINCYYKGYNLDPDSQKCEDGSTVNGVDPNSSDGPQICDLSWSPSEDTSNHIGKKCGDFRGAWETSHFVGLAVPAFRYYARKVMDEIQAGQVNIGARCSPPAADYSNYLAKAKALSDNITANNSDLPTKVFKSGINYCAQDQDIMLELKKTGNFSEATLAHVESKIPKSALCYMSMSRSGLEAMFTHIVSCEIFSRVNQVFVSVADKETSNLSNIVQDCFQKATDYGNQVGHDQKSQSAGEAAGNSYFDKCYNPQAKSFFQGIINKYMPGPYMDMGNTTSSMEQPKPKPGVPALPFPFLFFFGTLGAAPSRRRRLARILTRTLAFVGVNATVLSFATYYSLGGCCDSPSTPPVPTSTCLGPQPPAADADVHKCCSPGDASQPNQQIFLDKNLCKSCHSIFGCGDIKQDLDKAAADGQTIEDAQSAAGGMASHAAGNATKDDPTPQAASPGFAGQQAQATAGGIVPTAAKKDAKGGGVSLSGPEGPHRGGGAGGGGGSAAGPGVSSGLTTAASADGLAASAGSGPTTNDADAAYKSGGNAGGGGSGDGDGMHFHSGGSALSATSGDASFGGGDEGAKVDAMGSQDPDDYFTRTNLTDSLFKKVHERYSDKARGWTMTDLQNAAKGPGVKPAAPKSVPAP